ncbi:hypothetical protein [Flexithrix dorotheae]|uniref:hypothetical protein n=1 Tax=Flexithrix dorotheae TaxID=70993 RepID=UPI0004771916|nr:hypothetical protein [Flexithrix dorotheae]
MRTILMLAILGFMIACDSRKFEQSTSDKLLAAYYFGAGYFTLVPANIRHDLDEMKQLGTDIVCIGITENDIKYNDANIKFIVEEAHQRGMQVYVVPSRMAGITAGQPVEPPLFGYHHPHTVTIKKDDSPIFRKSHGILSSFYHPEVKDYFISLTSKMVTEFNLDGVIWDEPKSTFIGWQDFSPLALQHNPDSSYVVYMEDFARFFSDVNAQLKKVKPELQIVFFDEACRNDTVVQECAKIQNLDFYGADGHPYPTEKSEHTGNRALKVLPVWGERFLKAGRKNGLKTMMLVENHYLTGVQLDHMEETLPEIINYDLDMLIYYYYGFYKDDTERNMDIIKKNIKKFKQVN